MKATPTRTSHQATRDRDPRSEAEAVATVVDSGSPLPDNTACQGW